MKRVLARRGDRALVYRAPGAAVASLLVLVAALVTTAILADYLVLGIAASVVAVVVWLRLAIRMVRLAPSGRRGRDGPFPPGGAGVREPRRPVPSAPSGSAPIVPDAPTFISLVRRPGT